MLRQPSQILCSYKMSFHAYGYKLPIRKNNITLFAMYTLQTNET